MQVTKPEITIEKLWKYVSEAESMNRYLKENKIEMAAQRATSVLSVLNHAPTRKRKLKEKVKVGIAVLL